MVTINYKGRLGNNMIQYVAGYIFSKKHSLKLKTPPKNKNINWGSLIGVTYSDGYESKSNKKIVLNDNNFIDYLNMLDVDRDIHYHIDGYFQQKEFLYDYLEEIQKIFKIGGKNNVKKLDEVFVAYRIGDISGSRSMLPIEYYEEALDIIGNKKGYITSDSPNHPNVIKLSKKYNLEISKISNPIEVIKFANKYNNIILSEGTFSWWVGFFSGAENIIVNKRDWNWCGETLFDIPEWKQLSWDYDNSYVNKNNKNKLTKYIPINYRLRG